MDQFLDLFPFLFLSHLSAVLIVLVTVTVSLATVYIYVVRRRLLQKAILEQQLYDKYICIKYFIFAVTF